MTAVIGRKMEDFSVPTFFFLNNKFKYNFFSIIMGVKGIVIPLQFVTAKGLLYIQPKEDN